MAEQPIYLSILEAKRKGEKKFVVLIDPDEITSDHMEQILALAIRAEVDYFFIGGSLIINNQLDFCLQTIRSRCSIPTILFPGNAMQLSHKADGILFLSLISGRNPDLLIGQHVITAPYLKASPLEVIPTGYMLIDGGVATSVSYMSNTQPIPAEKPDVALSTALAGEMLGLKMIYLDAGSGARNPIDQSLIATVSKGIQIPLIVGGGIRSPARALAGLEAGADLIVVGNAIEKKPELLLEMAEVVHGYQGTTWNGRPLDPREDLRGKHL